MGGRGSSGKASSGAGGSAQSSGMRAFDEASTQEKLRMLNEHNGSLTAKYREDGLGDEELWNRVKAGGTLLEQGKDYTVSDEGTITLKSTRERLTYSKVQADQNDSVSSRKGTSTIYKGKNGELYMYTFTRKTNSMGRDYIDRELRKVNL